MQPYGVRPWTRPAGRAPAGRGKPTTRQSMHAAWPCLLLGLAASVLVCLTEPPIGAGAVPVQISWFKSVLPGAHDGALSAAGLVGILGLLGAWVWLIRLAYARRLRLRVVAGVCAAWALPLLVAGPVLSSDVYAYGAIGAQISHGLDPYANGPAVLQQSLFVPHENMFVLHQNVFLKAMDPHWAHATAPYGPIGLILLWLAFAVAQGALHPTLWVLLGTAAAATAIAVALVVSRTAAPQRALATAVLAGSPVFTVGLIGSGHIDAYAIMFAAGAALAWRRDRPFLAVALAAFATSVKAPFGLLVLTLVIASAARRDGSARVRHGGALTAVAAGCYLVPAAVFGNPLQLLHSLSTPYNGVSIDSPPAAAAWLLRHMVGEANGMSSPANIAVFGIAMLAGLVVALRSIGWARRADPLVCAGVGLAAITVTSPVLHPWYLVWAMVLLVPWLLDTPQLRWLLAVCGFSVTVAANRPPTPAGNSSLFMILLSALAAVALWWSAPREGTVGPDGGQGGPPRRPTLLDLRDDEPVLTPAG